MPSHAPSPWRDDASRHYRWEAFDLVAAGHHELGVVAVQVHLEAQLRFALRRAGHAPGDAELASEAVGRPTQPPVSLALARDLGVDLERAGLVEPLNEHLERVKGVLGAAARVSLEEAQASLDVVDALWAEIARAASPPAPGQVPGVDAPRQP